jgi:aqualysin 1
VVALSALSLACSDTALPTGAPTEGTTSGNPQVSSTSRSNREDVIPDQYIIRLVDSVSDVPGLAKRISAQYGKDPLYTFTTAVKGFAARIPKQAIEGLSHNPNIASIEEDAVMELTDVQTPAPSWGLDRIDQRSSTLDGSYAYANNGAGVSVYIIDSGIRTTHVDFGGRASGAFTAINDGNGTNDCSGHGTHVAGTVGGRTYGVAKAVRLYAVRVLGCDGSGSTSGVIAGVDWVTKNHVAPAVANMSLGGSSSSTLAQAVQNSIASGVVYAVAAGNSAVDACTITPANVAAALTVGASNQYGWSESYSNTGTCVDLYAPGRAIISTWNSSDTAYAGLSGTSMASPHVAGAAALVLAANPTATATDVAKTIVANATGGALTSVGAGTPNLLLFTGFLGGTAQVPSTPPDTTPTVTPSPPSTTTDQPPVASFSSSCPKGTCTFDASTSSDDVGIASYVWDFGDGASSVATSSQKVTHAYKSTGTFTVRLSVMDTAGQSSTVTRLVSIRKAA